MADAIIGILLLFFCLYYTVLTNQLPGREIEGMVGVAFMPRLLTIVLASLALLLTIRGLRGWRARPGPSPSADLRGIAPTTLALAALLIYPLAMARAGFLLTTPLFFGAFMVIAGSRDPRRILLGSLVATGTVYLSFSHFFGVPLPRSPFY